MAFTPHVSGSCLEGTKVMKPDEMDVVCVLRNFQNLSFTDCDDERDVTGFVNNSQCESFADIDDANTDIVEGLVEIKCIINMQLPPTL